MTVFQKIRREILKTASRISIKSARVDYFGLKLKIPLVNGIGSGYLVPADKWMSKCLSVFLKSKKGAIIDIGAT